MYYVIIIYQYVGAYPNAGFYQFCRVGRNIENYIDCKIDVMDKNEAIDRGWINSEGTPIHFGSPMSSNHPAVLMGPFDESTALRIAVDLEGKVEVI